MKLQNKNKFSVDFLFIITLFCIFLLCGIFVILFGVRTYQHIITAADQNYFRRTSAAYITGKIHQHDTADAIDVLSAPSGDNCLRLKDIYNNSIYYTYLFVEDGALRELTLPEDLEFDYTGGTKLFEVSHFGATKPQPTLFYFNVTDKNNQTVDFYVSLRSASIQ